MKSKHEYHIKLRPLAKYFFGGERYYDEDDRVFYFEKSRAYPQQTSVLGMLRYQLLLETGLMENTKGGININPSLQGDAISLIGPKSFDGLASTKFGKITYLSPLVIIDDKNNHWVDFPKAKQQDGSFAELSVRFKQGAKMAVGPSLRPTSQIPIFDNFNHKKGIEYGFTHLETIGQDYMARDKVFNEAIQKEEQIGIYKAYRNKGVVEATEDRGFYKYQYCHLNPSFAFSCFLGSEEPLPLQTTIVRLGKERTPFKLEVTEKANPFLNADIVPGSQLLLLSDAYLKEDWSQYCKTAICSLIPFKNLRYEVAKRDNYDAKPNKSGTRLNLLRRGSLLWVSDQKADAKKLQRAFQDQAAFLAIGYNHYKVI